MNLAEIIFIVEDDDHETKRICQESGEKTIINNRSRSFAGAINTAVRLLDNEYFMGSNDDLVFHPNWLPPLLELSKTYGLVGINDMGNHPMGEKNAAFWLVNRRYQPKAVPGYPEDLVCEEYFHNFTDTEISLVAQAYGEYYYCRESIVEHMHPAWGKGEHDETYAKQDNTWTHDENIFYERSSFWMDYEKNELKDLR